MVYTQAGLWILLAGVVVLAREADCLRGSALVAELKNKAKAALLNPTETVEEVVTVEGDVEGGYSTTNVTITKTKSLLTGIPQKDYIYDPNLPRELNGYNLSSYPFYNGVPEDIDFKCDDLHDGFYASVPHKCQVYHHCLFGTRYDFLCANYTAFDQRTFICHFVSEVDCENSPKFFQRNEALYKTASTEAPLVIQTTTTTTAAPTTAATQRPRRRRPYRRRRPSYEYYYDDQYEDDEYYDDDPPPPRRKMNRKHRPSGGYRSEDDDEYYDERRDSSRGESSRADSSRGENSRGESPRSEGARGEGVRGDSGLETSKEAKPIVRVSGPALGTVYDKPRVAPKIRRPVPVHERDKYDYTKKSDGGTASNQDPKKPNKAPSSPEEDEDEYYDEEYEDDFVKSPPKRNKGGSDFSSESTGKSDSRRPSSRHRPRQNPRRRPDRYEDDDYEQERPVRPRKRTRHEDPPQTTRGTRGGHRGYSRDEPDPVPADRPGFISGTRYSPGSRKRLEEDRSSTTKRPHSRVVYEDEEDDEEYYDDEEEEEPHDDETSRRNNKQPSSSTGSGRRNEDSESDTGRKQFTPINRKSSGDTYSSKPNLRSDLRPQSSGNHQVGSFTESVKPINGQKPDSNIQTRGNLNERCKSGCDGDSDYLEYDDSVQEKVKNSDRNKMKQSNSKDDQKQINDRDRVFSSRFRDSLSETKTRQNNYDQTGSGKSSSSLPNYRTSGQNTDSSLRSKPTLRQKSNSEESISPPKPTKTSTTTTTTTTEPSVDYSDESSTNGNKYSNFRSKGRVIPPISATNNYKTHLTTEEIAETYDSVQPSQHKTFSTEDPVIVPADRTSFSQRHYSNQARRPVKVTTESTSYDELTVPPKVGVDYRQPSVMDVEETEEEEETTKGTISSSQNYRRTKIEPSQVENSDYNQSKLSYIGNKFRRPIKPVEEINPDDTPLQPEDEQSKSHTTEENLKKVFKPSLPDKFQLSSPSYGGAYRRVKVSAIPTSTPELEVSTSNYDNTQSFQEGQLSNPVNSFKRPYTNGRPLSNYPVVVEDTTKNTLAINNPYRRPLKQRVQDNEQPLGVEGYNPTSTTSGIGESYIKVEQGLGINLRPSLAYFPPKRGKLRIDDNSARGLEQYPKQFSINQDQFSKQTPKLEVTAPGPSAPGDDIASVKSNSYNNASPRFPLDIPEEEYDVTLNDALQPSTLHPTRSLVDFQQNRLKTRDYQSNLGRSPEYVNRGRVAYLLPAASQQYITRVQSVYTPDKQEQNPVTSRYTDNNKSDKKDTSLDQEEYEAVVLTAPSDQWSSQQRNRPTEWYW